MSLRAKHTNAKRKNCRLLQQHYEDITSMRRRVLDLSHRMLFPHLAARKDHNSIHVQRCENRQHRLTHAISNKKRNRSPCSSWEKQKENIISPAASYSVDRLVIFMAGDQQFHIPLSVLAMANRGPTPRPHADNANRHIERRKQPQRRVERCQQESLHWVHQTGVASTVPDNVLYRLALNAEEQAITDAAMRCTDVLVQNRDWHDDDDVIAIQDDQRARQAVLRVRNRRQTSKTMSGRQGLRENTGDEQRGTCSVIHIDRDPKIFRHLVNTILRGYPAECVPPWIIPAVRADCAAFGLLPAFYRAFPPISVPARFVGAGTSKNGTTLQLIRSDMSNRRHKGSQHDTASSSGPCLVGVATPFVKRGVVEVVFLIEVLEEGAEIGIGVISPSVTAFDRPFHNSSNTDCAVYLSDGTVHSTFSDPRRVEDTSHPFTAGMLISVRVDCSQRCVGWKRVFPPTTVTGVPSVYPGEVSTGANHGVSLWSSLVMCRENQLGPHHCPPQALTRSLSSAIARPPCSMNSLNGAPEDNQLPFTSPIIDHRHRYHQETRHVSVSSDENDNDVRNGDDNHMPSYDVFYHRRRRNALVPIPMADHEESSSSSSPAAPPAPPPQLPIEAMRFSPANFIQELHQRPVHHRHPTESAVLPSLLTRAPSDTQTQQHELMRTAPGDRATNNMGEHRGEENSIISADENSTYRFFQALSHDFFNPHSYRPLRRALETETAFRPIDAHGFYSDNHETSGVDDDDSYQHMMLTMQRVQEEEQQGRRYQNMLSFPFLRYISTRIVRRSGHLELLSTLSPSNAVPPTAMAPTSYTLVQQRDPPEGRMIEHINDDPYNSLADFFGQFPSTFASIGSSRGPPAHHQQLQRWRSIPQHHGYHQHRNVHDSQVRPQSSLNLARSPSDHCHHQQQQLLAFFQGQHVTLADVLAITPPIRLISCDPICVYWRGHRVSAGSHLRQQASDHCFHHSSRGAATTISLHEQSSDSQDFMPHHDSDKEISQLHRMSADTHAVDLWRRSQNVQMEAAQGECDTQDEDADTYNQDEYFLPTPLAVAVSLRGSCRVRIVYPLPQ